MNIEKICISNDPAMYEAWPDLVLTPTGKLLCVFTECKHHKDRSYTRIMLTDSVDNGRTWSPKRPLTEGTAGLSYSYNCARISALSDGRLVVIVDRVPETGEKAAADAVNRLYFSSDDGVSWSEPVETPLRGIVPDKLRELDNGRWISSAHYKVKGNLTQFCRWSDDQGKTWSDEIVIGYDRRYNLCEVCILPFGGGKLVAFMRENSGLGRDCIKSISYDNGETWSPLVEFPLPGCHRPVAGILNDGRIFITYRFMQGGNSNFGFWTQNFFGAITDRDSVFAVRRSDSGTRIIPIDFDRSPLSDLGYSGWVQLPDGSVYIASYIVDDAIDKGQIRGYRLKVDDFILKN